MNHPSGISAWLSASNLSGLGHTKFSQMTAHFKHFILPHLSLYFKPLGPPIRELWKALFPSICKISMLHTVSWHSATSLTFSKQCFRTKTWLQGQKSPTTIWSILASSSFLKMVGMLGQLLKSKWWRQPWSPSGIPDLLCKEAKCEIFINMPPLLQVFFSHLFFFGFSSMMYVYDVHLSVCLYVCMYGLPTIWTFVCL